MFYLKQEKSHDYGNIQKAWSCSHYKFLSYLGALSKLHVSFKIDFQGIWNHNSIDIWFLTSAIFRYQFIRKIICESLTQPCNIIKSSCSFNLTKYIFYPLKVDCSFVFHFILDIEVIWLPVITWYIFSVWLRNNLRDICFSANSLILNE